MKRQECVRTFLEIEPKLKAELLFKGEILIIFLGIINQVNGIGGALGFFLWLGKAGSHIYHFLGNFDPKEDMPFWGMCVTLLWKNEK